MLVFMAKYEEVEVLQYTGLIWKGFQVYFDPLIFPLNDGFHRIKGMERFALCLWMQAQCNGYNIVLNGCPSKKHQINVKYAVIEV